MAKKKNTYLIANWKMNPATTREASALFSAIKKAGGRAKRVQTVVCPPFLFVPELAKKTTSVRVSVGGQDAFWEPKGAYTGEVSARQLKKAGAQYVILGHSERRALGETSEDTNRKIKAVLKEGLWPVVCIGERERDEDAEYLRVIERQLKDTLAGIGKERAGKLIVTYEPIWAISANKGSRADSPEDTEETILYIRKILSKIFNKKVALEMPILYGGSANPNNTEALLARGGVQGLLVGGASLDKKAFGEMIRIADAI